MCMHVNYANVCVQCLNVHNMRCTYIQSICTRMIYANVCVRISCVCVHVVYECASKCGKRKYVIHCFVFVCVYAIHHFCICVSVCGRLHYTSGSLLYLYSYA